MPLLQVVIDDYYLLAGLRGQAPLIKVSTRTIVMNCCIDMASRDASTGVSRHRQLGDWSHRLHDSLRGNVPRPRRPQLLHTPRTLLSRIQKFPAALRLRSTVHHYLTWTSPQVHHRHSHRLHRRLPHQMSAAYHSHAVTVPARILLRSLRAA
jgi:hypothetical protein